METGASVDGVLGTSGTCLTSPVGLGSSQSCEKAFSKEMLNISLAPSGRAFVTAACNSPRGGLNWCGAVKMGDDMVVVFSFNAFARNELLAGCLVSFGGALTTQSSVSTERSLVSSIRRILYRLVDSNTGGQSVGEVIKAHPETWGGGIFKCAVCKMSACDIKVSDRPTGEKRSSVCKSLVITAESGA